MDTPDMTRNVYESKPAPGEVAQKRIYFKDYQRFPRHLIPNTSKH